MHSTLNISSKLPELDEQYQAALLQGHRIYTDNNTYLERLSKIRFLTMLLTSRISHMNVWINKTKHHYIQSVFKLDEATLENVIFKSMKLCDVEKRIADKKSYKNQAVIDGRKLLSLSQNQDVKNDIKRLENEWDEILKQVESQRHRLDELITLWREFKLKAESLEQWLSLMLVSVLNRNGQDHQQQQKQQQLDAIALEHEFLTSLQNDLKSREHEKMELRQMKDRISTYVQQHLRDNINENTMLNIEKLWMELSTALLSQLKKIATLSNQVEIDSVNEMISSLKSVISKTDDVFDGRIQERWLNGVDLENEVNMLKVRRIKMYIRINFFLFNVNIQ